MAVQLISRALTYNLVCPCIPIVGNLRMLPPFSPKIFYSVTRDCRKFFVFWTNFSCQSPKRLITMTGDNWLKVFVHFSFLNSDIRRRILADNAFILTLSTSGLNCCHFFRSLFLNLIKLNLLMISVEKINLVESNPTTELNLNSNATAEYHVEISRNLRE